MKVKAHIQRITNRLLKLPWSAGPCLAGLLLIAATARATTPEDPAVEFRFAEGPEGNGGNGITTTNSGSLGGLGTFAQPVDLDWETNPAPIFSTNVPVGTYVPADNDLSVDMVVVQGSSAGGSHGRAIDLMPDQNPPTVGAFPELTVCGWMNVRQPVNNQCRIVSANESPNGLGFDLAMRNSGQISLGVNQYNDISRASLYVLPIDADTPETNWVFFAVTYNPNLGSGQLKYYFGRADKLAALDVERDYTPPLSSTIDYTGQLTVGNFSSMDGNRDSALGGNSFIFRGLLDEIRVYTNALTLEQVQEAQINGTVTPVAATIIKPPVKATATEGQSPAFTVDATGSGLVTYQWKTNDVDVPGATTPTLILANVQLSQNNITVRVGVSNSVGGVLSDPVTLTVLPANPFIVSYSFSEGAGNVTANLGSLAGYGQFQRAGGLPNFISTNVPSGPYAPSPVHNPVSLNFGPNGANRAVDLTNTLVSAGGELGSLNALTVCGWINSGNHSFRTTSTGRGNGVVTATRGGTLGGFVLSYRSDNGALPYGQNGKLQFHVNDFQPDFAGGANLSSTNKVPLNTNLPPENWIFFAVTYDGTSSADNLAFYFGDPQNEATNDVVRTYNRGVITNTGRLTIGNNQTATGNPTGRTISGDNGAAFRGLIDEVKVFSKVLTLEEIREQQISPALPTLLVYSNSGPNLVFSWETLAAYPYQLQSRTNLVSGGWSNVTASESVSGNIHTVTVPTDKEAEFFRIQRQ